MLVCQVAEDLTVWCVCDFRRLRRESDKMKFGAKMQPLSQQAGHILKEIENKEGLRKREREAREEEQVMLILRRKDYSAECSYQVFCAVQPPNL